MKEGDLPAGRQVLWNSNSVFSHYLTPPPIKGKIGLF